MMNQDRRPLLITGLGTAGLAIVLQAARLPVSSSADSYRASADAASQYVNDIETRRGVVERHINNPEVYQSISDYDKYATDTEKLANFYESIELALNVGTAISAIVASVCLLLALRGRGTRCITKLDSLTLQAYTGTVISS